LLLTWILHYQYVFTKKLSQNVIKLT